jgi:phosphatidylglycerol:prolipoprotein diacylglycerol transferase
MIPFIHIGPLSIGTFGLMMWLAFVAAFFVLDAEFRRREFKADSQVVIGVSAIAGIVGAKIYHVLDTPGDVLFSRTGFAWFGGFIAGLLALIYFARRYRIPMLAFLDACAPAAAVGYAVGRIGCLLSGDGDYGKPTSLPWGMSFPNGLVPTTERVHPTPIYEFIAGILIAYYLWKLSSKVIRGLRPQGDVLAMFLILSGIERFLVEFIRINPRVFFGLSNAQVASLASLIAGIVLIFLLNRHAVQETKRPARVLQQR